MNLLKKKKKKKKLNLHKVGSWYIISWSKIYLWPQNTRDLGYTRNRIHISKRPTSCPQSLRKTTEPCCVLWILIKWTIWKGKKFQKTNLHKQLTFVILSTYKSESITGVLMPFTRLRRSCSLHIFIHYWVNYDTFHSNHELIYLLTYLPLPCCLFP